LDRSSSSIPIATSASAPAAIASTAPSDSAIPAADELTGNLLTSVFEHSVLGVFQCV
jgi:hypothetical protein